MSIYVRSPAGYGFKAKNYKCDHFFFPDAFHVYLSTSTRQSGVMSWQITASITGAGFLHRGGRVPVELIGKVFLFFFIHFPLLRTVRKMDQVC